jgi:hypothetical protein
VHREPAGGILRAEVTLIQRIAGWIGLALANRAWTERAELAWALSQAVNDFYQVPGDGLGDSDPATLLLRDLGEALRTGLGVGAEAARVYVWRYNDGTHEYDGLWGVRSLPHGEMRHLLDGEYLLVRSAPPGDGRLAPLLRALPAAERAQCQLWQCAVLVLARSEQDRPLPNTVFLLAVEPPHRLSYNRAADMLWDLNLIVARHNVDPARTPAWGNSPHRPRRPVRA